MTRSCYECGATSADEASFPRPPKLRRKLIVCSDCARDPLSAQGARIRAHRERIAALRAKGRYRAPKPFHTAPLFAGLRA
jgi:hypothetical protein